MIGNDVNRVRRRARAGFGAARVGRDDLGFHP